MTEQEMADFLRRIGISEIGVKAALAATFSTPERAAADARHEELIHQAQALGVPVKYYLAHFEQETTNG